jgi:hypothetical protein
MRLPNIIPIVVCSTLTAMCSDAPPASSDRISPVYNAMTSRLEVLKYDANGNGTFDTFSHMDGTKVQWIEIDRDEDGKTDRWEYYGPDQKLLKVGLSRRNTGKPDSWVYRDADGTVAKTEYASKDEGPVDRTEFYEHDLLVRVEEDTDGDGKLDRWETYAGGALTSAAYDSRHRGAPDRRLVYRADGALDRIETDVEGNGSFTRVSRQP